MDKGKNIISIYRILICFFAIISLSACVEDELKEARAELNKTQSYNAQILLENKHLRSINNTDYNRNLVNSQYMEIEAAVTQACKQPFNINFCPKSITDIGEEAIKQNFSGGDQLVLFWSIYIMKFFLMMIVVVAPVSFLIQWWSTRIKPNFEAFSTMEKATLAGEAALSEIQKSVKTEELKLVSIAQKIRSNTLRLDEQRRENESLEIEFFDLKTRNKSIADDNERLKAFSF